MFDHSLDRRRGSLPGWLPSAGILGVYAVVAAFYTWPLLEQSHSRIANDYYDPILNASIL